MFNLKALSIVKSFSTLRGNTAVTVLFQPMWGLPYAFYNFYLSLYMKGMGITDQQLGIILAVSFISGAVFSLFGGLITDMLGRKKTTFLFDFIAWPLAIFIFLISNSFWMFILGTVVNNAVKIVGVSWNLMVVEDASSEQRTAAFNLISIINISVGILTPFAGFLVAKQGVVASERIFMIVAIISMSTMILIRHRFYKETRIGQQILDEHKGLSVKQVLKKGIYGGALKVIRENPGTGLIVLVTILFNLSLPLGTYSSIFFAPFMTDHAGIDKAMVSTLSGVFSVVMLFSFLMINPRLGKFGGTGSILTGLAMQAVSILMMAFTQGGSLVYAGIWLGFYALGYGIFRPYMDTALADVTEGKARAGIYSFINTATSVFGAVFGLTSGYIYAANPRMLFYITAGITVLCILGMMRFKGLQTTANREKAE